ncbi:plasmid partitioning/stability family protein (plasmid) [Serratia marcescens]|uniref:plasmid partitioning/stability family protein n=1 Tax=Serratia marcescens TaxID=615 RepID=UPI003EDB11C6
MTDNRKCSFYIYPDRNAADRVADGFLEKLPQKERGRAMRAMMLCGARADETGRTPAVPDR